MGLTQEHALGRRQKFFVESEVTAGTFVKATATGAAKMLNTTIAHGKEFKVRDDSRQHRSALERIEGRSTVTWSCDGYLIPSGTKNLAPDCGALIEAAMGTETVNANDVTYSLASTQAMPTLSITRHYPDVLMESIWLAVVNSMTISASGGAEPTIAFEGMAGGYAVTGTSTLDSAMATTDQMEVQPGDTRNFNVNSVVQVGSNTNSSAGYQIDTVNHTTNTHTLETSITTAADESVVKPYTPTETTAGSPINGITGSISFDGGPLAITSFDLTVTNNVKMIDDQVAVEYPDDAIPGWREVTGNISFRCRKDHLILFNDRDILGTRAIVVVLGTAGGSGTGCTITIPYAELDFSAIEVPTAEEAVLNVPFVAIGSSGNDELTIKFD